MKYKLMLEDIAEITNTDFVVDMECKRNLDERLIITQDEVKEMVDMLTAVYKIAHTVSCHACREKRYM